MKSKYLRLRPQTLFFICVIMLVFWIGFLYQGRERNSLFVPTSTPEGYVLERQVNDVFMSESKGLGTKRVFKKDGNSIKVSTYKRSLDVKSFCEKIEAKDQPLLQTISNQPVCTFVDSESGVRISYVIKNNQLVEVIENPLIKDEELQQVISSLKKESSF